MSTPVLNAPHFQAPGQPAGAGQGVGAKAPAGGVLAGFEAMLAALFGQVGASAGIGQTPVANPLVNGQPVDPKAAKDASEAKTGKDAKGAAETKADDAAKVASDATLTLAAGSVAQPLVAAQPAATTAAAGAPGEAAGDGHAQAAGPQIATTLEPLLAGAPGAAKAALLQAAGPAGAEAKGLAQPADPAAGAPQAEPATQKLASFTPPALDAQAAATPAPAKPTVQAAADTPASPKTAPGDAPTTATAATTQAATAAPAPKAEPAARETPSVDAGAQLADATTPTLAQAPPPAPPRRADNTPRSSGRERGGKIQTAAAGAAPGLHATPLVGRTEGAKTEAAADPIAAATGSADPAAPQAAQEASKDSSGPAFAQTDPNNQTPAVATPAAMHAAAVAVRGAPQTVANLAAQIVKKLESKTTRFDVQLDPAGLGKVDVRVEIGAEGRITAALACHTAQGAEALKARSGELQQALEQAGFDVSGGLSFEMAGGQGGQTGAGQGQNDTQNNSGQAFRGRAFQSGLDIAGDAAQAAADLAARLNRSRSAGVDIRI